jgi:serine/threonine-protein kinase
MVIESACSPVDSRDEQTMARVGLVDAHAPQTTGAPRIGEVIAEKYRVERVLGIGGMGIVLAVTHLQLGEPYAIKCLLPGGAADPETVERFMREARAAVRIKSEHIARVSDVGQLASGAPYILMEYLTGQDLSELLESAGPLSVRDAVEYVLQACTGIAEAHALGIVHRDLKPSNLFLTKRLDGASLVKVLDFGISKALGDGAPDNPSLTQTTSVFGSPAYMSPEQIRSAKNVDFRTDVWALGVILFELLTGKTPFTAETSGGLLSAIAADEPHRLRELRPDAGAELDAIVARCLEKKVQNRFQSVSELASALEPFRSANSLVSVGRIRRLSNAPPTRTVVPVAPLSSSRGLPVTEVDVGAATDKAWTTAPHPPKGGRAILALVAAAVVASLAVGGWYAVLRSHATTPSAATRSAADPPAATSSQAPVASPAQATTSLDPTPPSGSATPSAMPLATAPRAPGARPTKPGASAQAVAPSSAAAAAATARKSTPVTAATAPSDTTPGTPVDPFGSSH